MDDKETQEILHKAFANVIVCEHIPPDKVFIGEFPMDPDDFDIRRYGVITDVSEAKD